MVPWPPCPTLFPYTTLFRSMLSVGGANPGDALEFAVADLESDAGWPEAVAGCTYVLHVASPLDRKSTRLNSSHLGISYAVFCLKKKRGAARGHFEQAYKLTR